MVDVTTLIIMKHVSLICYSFVSYNIS